MWYNNAMTYHFETSKDTGGIPLYQVTKLLGEMKKRGFLVTSKPTYLKYEKEGVFKPGKHSLIKNNRIERLFTVEEIAENIQRYSDFVSKQT